MRRLLATLAVLLACVVTLAAATYLKFEAVSVTATNGGVGFTAANINNTTGAHLDATQAMCMVSSAAINYQVDGATVTSAVGSGIPATIGTPIYLLGNDVLNHFRAVTQGSTGNAVLNCLISRP